MTPDELAALAGTDEGRKALSLEGRWFGGARTLEEQMIGLDTVRRHAAQGASVLDLGCAEGHIAGALIRAGATVVHGCEILIDRVEAARKHCAPSGLFFTCDLDGFDLFYTVNRQTLLDRYGVVLCLSIAHKLSAPDRFLARCARLAGGILAVRLPSYVIDDARSGNRPLHVPEFLGKRGLRMLESNSGPRGEWVGVFRR